MLRQSGENLGILPIEKALEMAENESLDLVEIAPDAKPPVVKIISFDKFRYQKEKEEKKQRLAQKSGELKHVRLSPRVAINDLRVKSSQTEKFLEKDFRVEINLTIKGREKAHKERCLQKLKTFLELIKTPHKITSEPKKSRRGFSVQIIKK